MVGCAISTVCYALTIRATLGLGPLYAVQDGISRLLHISVGSAVMVVGVALVALAVGLRSWPGPGTLILPFLGGAGLDALLPHLPVLHGIPFRLAVVVLASWLMGLGGALIISARVGAAALDAVMLGLHRIMGRPLAPVRLAMEVTMLFTGWLLGGAVGVGSVITGLVIGPAMQFWMGRVGTLAISRPIAEEQIPRAETG